MKGWQFNKQEGALFPDEIVLSAFCTVEPKRMDSTLPFYYDESIFRFTNKHGETFYFKISPSYHEFEINIKGGDGELVYYQLLRTVSKVEILEDRRDHAELLIVLAEDRKRTVTSIELTVRPRFRVLVKEHEV